MVLPQLCFDDEDAELWEEDPQEFVRKVRAGVLLVRVMPHTPLNPNHPPGGGGAQQAIVARCTGVCQ